jgi:hypothetical protein
VPNASSALKNDEFMTDIIANWVNKKYVIGPFDSPPSFDFLINTLAACTAKKGKVLTNHEPIISRKLFV